MVTIILECMAGALIGYFFGAFPTGYFVGKIWNVDVRRHGSGRTGGTNVLRSAGWGAFLLTALGDVAKGFIAVLISRLAFPDLHEAHALALLGVLVGHNWSFWIAALAKPDPRVTYARPPLGWLQRVAQQGRGGAGVAVTAGGVLALFPPIALFVFPVFLVVLILGGYASLASMTAMATGPLAMLFFVLNGAAPRSYLVLAVVVAGIVIFVHIPNIQRLRAGTEKRFGERLGRRPPGAVPPPA